MINEASLRKQIERIRSVPNPTSTAFYMVYRDLVISIADGETEGDIRKLCQILAHAEIDAYIERAKKGQS